MRISDWSSDVCSSHLLAGTSATLVHRLVTRPSSLRLPNAPKAMPAPHAEGQRIRLSPEQALGRPQLVISDSDCHLEVGRGVFRLVCAAAIFSGEKLFHLRLQIVAPAILIGRVDRVNGQ